jgi:hypothetical protein
MSTQQLIDSAVEHLRASAGVKTVYGEPVTVDGKTVIPVAKVARSEGDTPAAAKPVGLVEIDGGKTKYLPFGQTKKLAIVGLIGSGIGVVVGWLLGRKPSRG